MAPSLLPRSAASPSLLEAAKSGVLEVFGGLVVMILSSSGPPLHLSPEFVSS